jgi:energy-coupling factor transporter ATP-binding protein EcfA2
MPDNVLPPRTTPTASKYCTTKTVVHHPRFQELQAKITECLEATAEAGEPQCLCLMGATGVGKSTLVQSYADTQPRYETKIGTKSPILYVETPHPITVKGMTSALLDALRDPRAFKGTQPEMNARLQGFLADCAVQLVILDDFHHLIDKKTNRILRDVSEWLKVLIKNTGIVYLVVGLEGEVEQILKANPQLSRLFVREYLRPFVWDMNDPTTVEDFARLMAYIQSTLEIQLTNEMAQLELLFRIHYATAGVMSNLMNLFRKARRIQRHQGKTGSPLTLETLSLAYRERLQAHVERPDPFEKGGKQALVQPASKNDDGNVDGVGRANQSHEPSIMATLTTK